MSSMRYIIVYRERRTGLAVVGAGESDRIDYDIASSRDFPYTDEGEAEGEEYAEELAQKNGLNFRGSRPRYLD